jgi:hypothetical protein
MYLPSSMSLEKPSTTQDNITDYSPSNNNIRTNFKSASIKSNAISNINAIKLVERARSRSSTKENNSLRNNINGISELEEAEARKNRSPTRTYTMKTDEAINEKEEDSLDTIPLNDDKSVFDHSFTEDFRDLLSNKNSSNSRSPNGMSKFIRSGKTITVDSIYNFNNLSDSNSAQGPVNQVPMLTMDDLVKKFKEDLLKAYRHDQGKRAKLEECFVKGLKAPLFAEMKNFIAVNYHINQSDDLIIFNGPIYEKNKAMKTVVYYFNGDYYEGELVNEKREGFGLFIYRNGTKYEGMFKANKQTGYGKLFQLDGEVYIGEWRDGRINGNGIRYHSNGDKYTGQYVNNIRNGTGTYIFSNGDRYEGEWVNGKANGKGKFIYSNGNLYEGEFVDNQICGKGTYSFANGDSYKGNFKNGLINGQGFFQSYKGDSYQGEFYNGKKHGFGNLYSVDGVLLCSGKFNYDVFIGKK